MKINPKDIQMVLRETNDFISLNDHFHNYYEMIFIQSGTCQFNIDKRSYLINQPAFIFINDLENHSMNVLDVPYKTYYLIIKKDILHALLEEPILYSIFKYRPSHFSHVIELKNDYSRVLNIIEQMYNELHNEQPLAYLAFKSLIQYLFIMLKRNHPDRFLTNVLTQVHHTVFDVQNYIDKNFIGDIGLESIAEQFFISPSYLSRSFKEITGYNLKEYIVLRRLSKAKELLLYSHDSIIEISDQSGFNNVNHFIRSFKTQYGRTPNEFRVREKI